MKNPSFYDFRNHPLLKAGGEGLSDFGRPIDPDNKDNHEAIPAGQYTSAWSTPIPHIHAATAAKLLVQKSRPFLPVDFAC